MEAIAERVDNTRLGAIRRQFEGLLPADWLLTTLGESFKWGSGGTPLRTNPLFYGGDIPWLIIGDLNDGLVTEAATSITEEGLASSATRWVEEGSVLLAMYGSIGKLGIAGRPLTTNQAIAFTKTDPQDAQYLFYYLMYSRESLASLGKGATQKNISQAVIKEFPFPLAPLPEQRRIVEAIELQLDRLDAAVARLHAAKAKLKRYKQAVLKAAYDECLSETDNQTSSLDEICSKITDGEHLRPNTIIEGVPFLSAKDIRDDDVSFANPLYVPEVDAEKYRKRCDPERGDILIVSRGATVGRMCIVRTDEVFCLLGSVILLKVQAGVDSQYVSWMIKSPDIQQQLTSLSGSTAQQAIYLKDIRKVELPIPPLEMQERFALEIRERYTAIDEMESTLDAQLAHSMRLRQSVLKRAFEGRLVRMES